MRVTQGNIHTVILAIFFSVVRWMYQERAEKLATGNNLSTSTFKFYMNMENTASTRIC